MSNRPRVPRVPTRIVPQRTGGPRVPHREPVLPPVIIHTPVDNSDCCDGFVYDQISPSDHWIIAHNLGKWPIVSVMTSDGQYPVVEVVNQDFNVVHVYFISPQTGKVVCL